MSHKYDDVLVSPEAMEDIKNWHSYVDLNVADSAPIQDIEIAHPIILDGPRQR